MRALCWFRSDLRVADNTALHAACTAATDGVVAVFTICPDQWQEHDWAPVKVDFLLRNLTELSAALAERGVPLLLLEVPRFAQVPERLLQLAESHGCDGLWFNREYEVHEQRRDRAVIEAFVAAGLPVRACTDQVVLAPDSIRTTQDRFYTVFTPFKKRWIQTVRDQGGVPCLAAPPAVAALPIATDPVPATVAGFAGLQRPDLWPAGEAVAQERLAAFVEQRLRGYDEARDLPGTDGTSRLSPYLALGVLSPRQCLAAALAANRNRLDSGARGVTTWISELVWREFYRHVLVGSPWVGMGQPLDGRTRGIRWREDDTDFANWQQGRTGIPIVDAGMRQLAATGWMHNRVRMITAMFLSKNLFIDWRRGERHFMQHLVDGDFASNNGGWQWSASVGADAAPYFRIFNPIRQSERFDPDGAYIRRFVPELAEVPGKAVHMPWERCPELAAELGYPQPIVDLSASRQRAIERFKEPGAASGG